MSPRWLTANVIAAIAVVTASCAGTTNYQYPDLESYGSDVALLHFVRKNSFYGAALSAPVKVDGNLVGKLGPGDSMTVKVPAQTITIATNRSEMKLDAEQGSDYYFEIYLPINGPIAFEEFEFSAVNADTARDLGFTNP